MENKERNGKKREEAKQFLVFVDEYWGDFWGGEGPDNGDLSYHPEGAKKVQIQ